MHSNASTTAHTPSDTTMGFREFADHLGCKPSYITQLKAEGRLVLTTDGRRVQVAASLARLQATRDPAKQPVAVRHAAARQAAADLRDAADDVQRHLPPNEPDPDHHASGYDFQGSKAKREHYAAERERAAYLKEAGDLMQRGDVVAAFADAGAAIRAAVDAWAADLPPMLAGQGEAAIRQTLADETERLLADLAARFHKLTTQRSA